MQKKVLSEIALYHGDVAMPKDWDIDRDKLQQDILNSQITDSPFPFSRTLDTPPRTINGSTFRFTWHPPIKTIIIIKESIIYCFITSPPIY